MLKNVGRDKYFRILADVYYKNSETGEWEGVNQKLIDNNLAVAYEGGTKVQ